ncbi:MAG: amino acid adenylation domain-containing protein [Gammaproteobacteria bacterium]|nr:amino acid adenylation domain-containing protein [Gammaproteobacteria bacterium]
MTTLKAKLSPYSKIFYNEWRINPDRSDYNIVVDQELYGEIDISRLDNAIKRFSQDYLLFHSIIKEENEQLYWIEDEKFVVKIDRFSKLNQIDLLKYVRKPFDLENGPLLRVALVKISKNHYRFIIIMHHIIIDGVKGCFFFETVSNYYNDDSYKNNVTLNNQCIQIHELSLMLESQLIENGINHLNFWQSKIQDIDELDLRFLKPAFDDTDKVNENIFGEYRFQFDENITEQVQNLKRKYKITPYIYSQTILAILLYRYTNQKKIGISYPIAIHEGANFIYGAHINTNITPYEIKPDMSILEVLENTKMYFKEVKANKHSYYPIQEIIASAGHQNILDVSFIQTNMRDKMFAFIGIKNVKTNKSLYVDLPGKLLFEQELKVNIINYRVRYNKTFIDPDLTLNFIESYKKIFIEILQDLSYDKGDRGILEYNIPDQDQYKKIVFDWNKTEHSYPQNKTIHQLFEEQVLKTPTHTALVYENITLTYTELNEQANQLAHYLIKNYKIGPDDLILLCIDRSQYMLIAILAILKAGGAYVPIDSSYPDSRISYILEDTKAKVLISNQIYTDRLENIHLPHKMNIIAIDSHLTGTFKKQKKSNPQSKVKSTHLAYVIYTSGTTGTPKGVMLEHRGIVNRICWMNNTYPLTEKDRILQKTPYVFDVSAWELFWANWYGAAIVFAKPDGQKEPNYLIDSIKKYKVSVIHFTPSMLAVFLDTLTKLNSPALLKSLRYLFCSGEALVLETVKRSHQLLPKAAIHNLYGPTEASIDVLYFDCTNKAIKAVYIGKPIANTQIYILDKNLSILPIGAIGELYIGGINLARGYLNRIELTQERFINNPFQHKSDIKLSINNKLYKTGDLARWLPDGNVEYIGRNDFQVKIRGYRIELGDIESKLICHEDIKQAVVIAKSHIANQNEKTDKYLAAYYVADNKLDDSNLYDFLATLLPEYMLPAVFIHLDKLPLTINGKLNTKALPDPKFNTTNNYVAPSNKQEQLICEAFSSILSIEKIGINDDFFKFGGNSIKTITLVSSLQANFNISVADIFNLKTPKQIAKNAPFEKNVLQQRLRQIKETYQTKSQNKTNNSGQQKQLDQYHTDILTLPKYNQKKPIANVLLTGATGYLGCNILNQLLTLTDYNIILLVRAPSSKDAYIRINKKFQFYFDKSLEDYRGLRLFVFAADLEKKDLGLPPMHYHTLVAQTNSIIHAAALTKHYGEYDKFYSANVQSTINLLEFAKQTKLRDFHYISTASILNQTHLPPNEQPIYTENDVPNCLINHVNVYIRSKYEAEIETIKYRGQGINTNIYRVGNLAFISSNGRVQENIEDNGFFNRLKCILNLGVAGSEIGTLEISPVDLTAQAIVKLFEKKQLSNKIFHLFNPNLCNINKLLSECKGVSIKILPINEFISILLNYLNKPEYQKRVERFLLHQGWLEENHVDSGSIQILQDRTNSILTQFGFKWPIIKPGMLKDLIEKTNI